MPCHAAPSQRAEDGVITRELAMKVRAPRGHRTHLVLASPLPTDGSWWLGKDRQAFSAYVAQNTARMSRGRCARFVPGLEGFGGSDRASSTMSPLKRIGRE